jgi:heterodisulfide reductase subunit A-like polyferredoxin
LRQEWEIKADLLTLASAIVPYRDEKLAQMFKVTLNENGFFLEAHVKLGPSEFATDGVFLCGLAHYPKGIDESITQARAAASRATTLLARKKYQYRRNSGLRRSASLLKLRRLCRGLPLQRAALHRRWPHRRQIRD